jgi:hypothetical protein
MKNPEGKEYPQQVKKPQTAMATAITDDEAGNEIAEESMNSAEENQSGPQNSVGRGDSPVLLEIDADEGPDEQSDLQELGE